MDNIKGSIGPTPDNEAMLASNRLSDCELADEPRSDPDISSVVYSVSALVVCLEWPSLVDRYLPWSITLGKSNILVLRIAQPGFG